MYLVKPLWNLQLDVPHKNNQDTVQVFIQKKKNLRMINTISLQCLPNFVNLPTSDGPCTHPADYQIPSTATANSVAPGFSKKIKIFALLPIQANPKI